ncbi:MAG TPA: arylsulfatase [Chitinophagaceae bacterium]|nr:arylsulfatase [Chitinophagaceae bacterium]
MKRWTALLVCIMIMSVTALPQTKPNIVLIVADDLGYGDLSCYGQQKFNTPNIDQLAAGGMRFTQFYAGTTVCAPSRSSLLSGQHSGHTYIRGNKEALPEGQEPIPDSVFTLAENLQKSGYVTGAFGKWGLGFVGSPGDPNKQGFNTFYGYNCQGLAHRYYPVHLWSDNKKIMLPGNSELKQPVTYAPDLIQKEALSFIEKNKTRPFFLYLPYTLPHAELMVPNDSIFAKFDGKYPESPFKGESYGSAARPKGYTSQDKPHATFAAMVSRLDVYVGQVMEKLKNMGIEKNTLIVFTSDNGPHQEGGGDPVFFNSSGGFRGVKRDLYEGGIRVPFIVSWPGKIRSNTVNDHISAYWDLFPTFTDVAGATAGYSTDGISILPALSGGSQQPTHPYLYWEFHEQGGSQAVRKGKWKLIKLQVGSVSPVFELYDLEKDQAETTNLATKYPEVTRELQKIIDSAHHESRVFPLYSTTIIKSR